MPKLIYPTSDARRLELLKRSKETAAADAANGNNYLSEVLTLQINETITGFDSSYSQYNQKLSVRQKEVREKNEAITRLGVFVRDFYEVLKRRAYRNNEPAEVLRFYNLPLSGEIPLMHKDDDYTAAALSIVTGDARAVEAGYPAMLNPTATEVNEKLTAALKEKNDVAPADRELDTVQKEMELKRAETDELIREIADTLRFALRKSSDSNQRRTIRTYGFEYSYLQGETVDEDGSGVEIG